MSSAPVLELEHATLRVGARSLWSDLDLQVPPGEFLAVLGANGSGKTSLLRTVLGLQALTTGRIRVDGADVRRGSRAIGYVPQQRRIDPLTPLRARDLVGLGIDGHRWGVGPFGAARRARRAELAAALAAVDALEYADRPVGQLSGGEQQRVRIAQALATDPKLLLCDEPLLSLDLQHQQAVTALVDRRRRTEDTAIIFVTHEINPVLPYVDRVLYLANGRFKVGTVDEVMTAETLTALYGVQVEVIRTGGRILVAGVPDEHVHEHDHVGAVASP